MLSGAGIQLFKLEDDLERYARIAGLLKHGSVYFTPSYLLSAQKAEGYPIRVIVASDGGDFALIPFVWRKINDLPFCQDISEDMFDIITPYEYSGVLTNVEHPEKKTRLLSVLYSAIDDLCRDSGVVTEFARFDPFITDIPSMREHYDIRCAGQHVFINLQRTNEEILSSFEHSAQKNIKTALRSGLQFHEAVDDWAIDIFIDLYWGAVKRLGARKYYYFNREYFFTLLKNCNGARLFVVRDGEGVPVAASILLYHGDIAYHHLTGCDPAALNKRPNDFMIYRLSLWAKAQGIRCLHLGGGADPVRGFKEKFSSARVPYNIGYRIHNMEQYKKLCEAFRAYYGANEGADYFPLYRFRQ